MPTPRKTPRLKQLEEKLQIVKKELEKRKSKKRSLENAMNLRKTKRNKTVFEECRNLVEKYMKTNYASHFLSPVDFDAVVDYKEVIKEPMDLSTIKTKLDNHEYQNPYEFGRDMHLICFNAIKYNGHKVRIGNDSLKLHRQFENDFEKIIENYENNSFTLYLTKILTVLMRHPESLPFRYPVDPKHLSIPDYFEKISQPMDLQTIYDRVHTYSSLSHFLNDINLVWQNAQTYNPPEHPIHSSALKLQEQTEKWIKRYFPEYVAKKERQSLSPKYQSSSLTMGDDDGMELMSPSNAHNMVHENPNTRRKNNHNDDDVNDMQQNSHLTATIDIPMKDFVLDSHNNMLQQQQRHQEQIESKFANIDELPEEEQKQIIYHRLLNKNEKDYENLQELSLEQKEELQKGIICLDPEKLEPVVNMLSQVVGPQSAEDELELDIDVIEPKTQVQIFMYVVKAIKVQEEERLERERMKLPNRMISNNNKSHSMTPTSSAPLFQSSSDSETIPNAGSSHYTSLPNTNNVNNKNTTTFNTSKQTKNEDTTSNQNINERNDNNNNNVSNHNNNIKNDNDDDDDDDDIDMHMRDNDFDTDNHPSNEIEKQNPNEIPGIISTQPTNNMSITPRINILPQLTNKNALNSMKSTFGMANSVSTFPNIENAPNQNNNDSDNNDVSNVNNDNNTNDEPNNTTKFDEDANDSTFNDNQFMEDNNIASNNNTTDMIDNSNNFKSNENETPIEENDKNNDEIENIESQ